MPARKPKPIDWSSTPNASRHRKNLMITLSDPERSALNTLANRECRSRSEYVGALVTSLAGMPRCARQVEGPDEAPIQRCGRPAPHIVTEPRRDVEWSACGEHAEAARVDGCIVSIGSTEYWGVLT